MRTIDDWKRLLRDRLREAMRSRDEALTAVMRETLAELDNAEAADPSQAPTAPTAGVIAGAVDGVGATEVARRVLAADEVAAIIEREIASRRENAQLYVTHGKTVEAERLQRQADALAMLRDA